MRRKLTMLFTGLCLTAALTAPASALEYSISAPGDPEYGTPTSIETVYTADGGARENTDVSKNAALIPPGFGTESMNALNTGEYLTPNLVSGSTATAGTVISGGSAAVVTPGSTISADSSTSSNTTTASTGYTVVTDDLYYSGGYLGTLKIPTLDLSVKVYQGTSSSTLKKGAGHFTDTSIWDGNVCLAAHNRGVNNYFGQIHTLDVGDKITWTTKLGTRTYQVTSVEKVSETDTSGLAATTEDQITLYTCVRNQKDSRWKVVAAAV